MLIVYNPLSKDEIRMYENHNYTIHSSTNRFAFLRSDHRSASIWLQITHNDLFNIILSKLESGSPLSTRETYGMRALLSLAMPLGPVASEASPSAPATSDL